MRALLSLGAFAIMWLMLKDAYFPAKPKPKPKSEYKVTRIDPVQIIGKAPGGREPRPLTISFILAASAFEKLAVSIDDIRQKVRQKARTIVPGAGDPTFIVSDVDSGYRVKVDFPDVVRVPSKSEIVQKVEAIDAKLKGRVKNVTIT